MSFPDGYANVNSWPEPSSQPSLGWKSIPSQSQSRPSAGNASASLFPSGGGGGGSQSQGGAFLSVQPNPQAETIQRMEGLLRSNKTKMDQIETLIVEKDKKLDAIREDIDKVRQMVLSTDKRTMRLLAPAMEKTFDEVRQGNIQIRQQAAESNRAVHRVENSVQAIGKTAVEMKAELAALKNQSQEIKNAFEAVLSESREMKSGMQAVVNESTVVKSGIQAMMGDIVVMKNGLQSLVKDTNEIKTDMHAVADEYAEIKKGMHSFVAEAMDIKNAMKAGLQSTMNETQGIKNGIKSVMNETQNGKKEVTNGIQLIMNESEIGKKGTEEIKNGIRSLMNESQGLKNGIQSVINESQEAKEEMRTLNMESEQIKNGIQSVANETKKEMLSLNNGILSLIKDYEGMKQDADKIKNGVQSVAEKSMEMEKKVLRLVSLKIDSDSSGSMDSLDHQPGSGTSSPELGRFEEGEAIQLAVAAEDSLFSPQPALDIAAAEANASTGGEDSLFGPRSARVAPATTAANEDALFGPQSTRVAPPHAATASTDLMEDSAYSAPLATRVAYGGYQARWEPPQTDYDDDSLFTEHIVEKNKASNFRRKWR